MGIKNLFTTLRGQNQDLFVESDFAQYCDSKIAVDASCYIHRYVHVRPEQREWLIPFANLIFALRRANVHPVFVYDGKPPVEKKNEIEKRKNEREKTADRLFLLRDDIEVYKNNGEISQDLLKENQLLNKDKPSHRIDLQGLEQLVKRLSSRARTVEAIDVTLSKELLNVAEVPWIQAPDETESEWICAELCRSGTVLAVMSEDSDLLPHMCPILLNNPKAAGPIWECTQISYDDVTRHLELTNDQFLEFCIMCGTDYNSNIPKVGPQTALKLLKKYLSIEGIATNTEYYVEVLNLSTSRSIFRQQVAVPIVEFSGIPEYTKLRSFCVQHKIPMSDSIYDAVYRRKLRIVKPDGSSEVVSPKVARILKPQSQVCHRPMLAEHRAL